MINVDAGGVLLFLLFTGAIAVGVITGEMPVNYSKTLDVRRDSNPIAFWGVATAFGTIAILGLAIAICDVV